MTKLSERVPSMHNEFLGNWLKELAEYVEFTDRRDRLAYRDLREQISKTPQKVICEYEPQTYDEAIALCKGWRRYVTEIGFIHWRTPRSVRALPGYGVEDGFAEYVISWEKDKWPDLWKEMTEAKIRKLYLSEISEEWVFNLRSRIYTDSTPGRVVCQAYLVYEGHTDWAKRLSKND